MTIDDISNMYKEEIYPALYTYAPLHDKYSKQSGNKNILAFMAANRTWTNDSRSCKQQATRVILRIGQKCILRMGQLRMLRHKKTGKKVKKSIHNYKMKLVIHHQLIRWYVSRVLGETIQGNATNNRTTPDSQQV
ncbi:hypothetical protein QVD17_29960 [Tagetes erecta]|uniref:Uncharacterized protein n=1 Tax=Tagetes erecta TaxID=13708 RepID=A0AAD8K2L5_TARER|nr:hypothetical protein QVD17_29960 [Tagetes erecta]